MINGNKLVSIIIPVFNRSEDLSRCLESITNLNYNNIEVIVIDDNSSEDIEVICNNYKKVYFYRNKVNGGPAESKNNGINRATGDFLWFIDSDAIIVDCNVLSCMINIVW